MKIEDAHLNFFESKEHYLNFRQAWKDHINSKGCSLDCVHHMIYAALRGRDLHKSFAPNYKVHGQDPYYAFDNARYELSRAIGMADNYPRYIGRLLAPFGETINKDTLISLNEIMKDWRMEDPSNETH